MSSASLLHHEKTSLIGSDMDSVPYLSPFGRLYRLSRLNGLWLHQLPHMFGIPPLLQQMLRIGNGVPWEALHAWDANSSTEGAHVQCTWRDWYPYRNGTVGESPTKLRGCPVCFAYGYHTMLHQLPWISSCPWHRVPLVDTCICGRNLLLKVRALGKAKLLACVCGNDHFDRRSALLGMNQWPIDEVHHNLTTYLNFSRNERKRTTLITTQRLKRSQAYARIEPVSESPYHRPIDTKQYGDNKVNDAFSPRIFDESTNDTSISDLIVSSILSTWSQLTYSCVWELYRIPITPSCYGRILQHASAIGLEASRRFGICDFIDISANDVYAQRRLIAESGSKIHPAPRIDGGIIGELGRLAQELFGLVCPYVGRNQAGHHDPVDLHTAEEALFGWSKTSQARTLALALSEITTLIAIDHLRGLLQIAPSIMHVMHFRPDLGAPILLVRDKPELKIIVGFARPSHPPRCETPTSSDDIDKATWLARTLIREPRDSRRR